MDKLHKCKQCNKSVSMISKLNCYLWIHTGEKPFPCTLCEMCFAQNSTLDKAYEDTL